MKKIYYLGFLGMLLGSLSASAAHLTPAEMQQRVKDGVARQLPANAYQATKGEGKAFKVRSNEQHSTVKNLQKNASTAGIMKKSKAVRPYSMTPDGGDIYGYLSYENTMSATPGLYELQNDGDYTMKWADPLYEEYWIQASNGWLVDGKIQGVLTATFMGFLNGYYSYVIDFETGELEEFNEEDLAANDIFMLLNAYNSTDGKIYGYAYNWLDDANIYWVSADFNNLTSAKALKYANEDLCYSLCYNSVEDCFYGVNVNQQFVRIDKEGNQTVVSDVPMGEFMATYITGLVWNPVTNCYFWNYNDIEDEAGLMTISADGEFDFLTDFYFGEDFTYFVTTDEFVDPSTPMRPSFDSVSFVNGSLNGTVTFTLPETFGDGSALPASIAYTALLDGQTYATGSGQPGSQVTVEYKVQTSGFHTFGLYVTVGDNNSATASTKVYVGNDTPLAPANVELTTTKVTWKAVTQSVNGGYMNLADMKYKVYVNDELVGETAETSISVNIPEDAPLNKYVASVVAVCNEMESAPGYSNNLVAGAPLQLPVYLEPTEDEFALMTVYDRNADDMTWSYDEARHAVYAAYTFYDPMDDFLFLPPVNVTSTDKFYTFNFESAIRSASWGEEYLTVYLATAPNPSAIIDVLVDTFTPDHVVSDDQWTETSVLWEAPEAGVYYLVLHCTSAEDQYGIYARNFHIEASQITLDSPAAPADVVATAGENGALEANVSFTFPTTTLNGEAIAAGAAMTAKVSVSTIAAEYTVEGVAGSQANVKVETVQGNNTVYVQVQYGELESPKTSTVVYTGVGVPATPTGVYVVEGADMLSAELHWNPVTTPDLEGTFIDPETVTYTIYEYIDFGFTAQWMPIEEGIKGTSYTYTVPAGSMQEIHTLGVVSYNEAGTNYTVAVVSNIFLGSPYELPLETVISENGITPEPWYMYSAVFGESYTGGWMLDYVSFYVDDFTGEDIPAILGYAQGTPSKGAVGLPRFSTNGCTEVQVSIEHLTGPTGSAFGLYGQVYGSNELIKIGEVEGNQGEVNELTSTTFTLPEQMLGLDWVQVYIMTEYQTWADLFLMTKCNVTSVTADGVLSVVAPSSLIRGQKGEVVVKGLEGADVTISTLTGAKVAGGKITSNEAAYSVAPGIYVVKAGNVTAKVIVK